MTSDLHDLLSFADAVKQAHAGVLVIDGIICEARLRRAEQRIFRAHHGTRDEYVWSRSLGAHVRIGASV